MCTYVGACTHICLLHQLREPKRKDTPGNFPGGPVVRAPGFYCKGSGSIFGWKTKIWQAVGCGQKKKKKEDKEKILQEQPQMLGTDMGISSLGPWVKHSKGFASRLGQLPLASALLWSHLTKLNHRLKGSTSCTLKLNFASQNRT